MGKKCDISHPKRVLSRMGERDQGEGVRESFIILLNAQASADVAGEGGEEDWEWECNCEHV